MSEPTQAGQSEWLVADLNEQERKFERLPLTDRTPIVRYVKLSTLFLYLSDRAFIPSLQCLQRIDSLEGKLVVPAMPRIQEFLDSAFGRAKEYFWDDTAVMKWLYPTEEEKKAMRAARWMDGLAERRAVWCWNLFEGESNAMWHLYGDKGVAIKSTIGHLKGALANSGCARRLMAPIRYGGPSAADVSEADANFDPQSKATWPFWLMRPYLFKNQSYRYEQEIRFVFGIHREFARASGVLIELDGKTLIQDVLFSDSIQKDEAQIILELFEKIRKGEMPSPVYPPGQRDLWQRNYNIIFPFTSQDDHPELFPDLTDYR
jgi:hypothetical protein